ncbi:hypothetical protein WJX81_003996 [Elliptochloris bilobata]|uniref:Cell cycle checkpoint protein RAD17 n=1 Tax=Elliptochloris bilobata TaxID=381761 RepID=A0AAW1RF44_9CHLO
MNRKRKLTVIELNSDDDDPPPKPRDKRRAKAAPERRGQLRLCLSQAPDDHQARPVQSSQSPGTQRQHGPLHLQPSQSPDQPSPTAPRPLPLWPLGMGGQAPPAACRGGELWVEKHAPASTDDLVVHKKKVADVRAWLQAQAQPGLARGASRLLLVSGPSGCGKTAVLGVLAHELGFELCEWRAPVPTLWADHLYQAERGVAYASKLDDFDSFVAHAKLAGLALGPSAASLPAGAAGTAVVSTSIQQGASVPPQKLVVVDDLPHAAGAEARLRLVSALGELAATARFPVVVVTTEAGGSGAGSDRGSGGVGGFPQGGVAKELAEAVAAAGAVRIAFNPLTPAFVAKALARVAEAEGLPLAPEAAKALAERCAGDLRAAMEALQLAATGAPPPPPQRKATGARGKSRSRGKAKAEGSAGEAAFTALLRVADGGRDIGLGPFHALGKLLYNKRLDPEGAHAEPAAPAAAEVATDAARGEDPSAGPAAAAAEERSVPQLVEGLRRAPQAFDAEAVVLHSGLDARTVIAFLHENMLHFVAESAVADAADALAYLSDADLVLRERGPGSTAWDADAFPATSLADAAAGSLAARGLAFSVAHPAPRRWLPLRGPAGGAAQRGAAANAARLAHLAWAAGPAGTLCAGGSARQLAAGVLPFARVLAAAGVAGAATLLPHRWTQLWDGQLVEQEEAGAGSDMAEQGFVEGAGAGGEAADDLDFIEEV